MPLGRVGSNPAAAIMYKYYKPKNTLEIRFFAKLYVRFRRPDCDFDHIHQFMLDKLQDGYVLTTALNKNNQIFVCKEYVAHKREFKLAPTYGSFVIDFIKLCKDRYKMLS